MGQLLTHIVCRTFGDDTIRDDDPLQQRLSEECVNALPWRNLEGLEKSRRVIPMPDGLQPVIDSWGRFWVDLDALIRAGREPLQGTAVESRTTLSQGGDITADANVTEDMAWLFDFDPDVEDLDWNALAVHGFPLPTKTSERRYELWNGQIMVGSMTEAAEEHFAGVRARIRELRAEHLVPAAGSATDS